MKTANIGEYVKAHLGNLHFGGIVKFKVATKDYATGGEKHTYTIQLPCGMFIETETLI